MGIGYMALWGFGAKCWLDGWVDGVDGVDTPSTVMTTRAPAMYFQYIGGMKCMYV